VSKRERLKLTPDLTTTWATGNDNFNNNDNKLFEIIYEEKTKPKIKKMQIRT
jgi:hypothetical protein